MHKRCDDSIGKVKLEEVLKGGLRGTQPVTPPGKKALCQGMTHQWTGTWEPTSIQLKIIVCAVVTHSVIPIL